ncbi:hypothetical protein GGE43_002524 [Agrobacterium tumefaciens]|uniref:GmrSD restriction endonucleases N-terminal domain-containing protein n=1 Tax=Agrobacterium radiobacter TaxID=362 RepID=A0ABR6J967_AGRRD|nr:DUF262 domain-containing protein [Agrobacterium radiobacter]MBB4282628.1 hypothetical protein [Agrobacterium radiobacter]MBB4318769.1 hypothetical protein [Agrobacterium radiobacter]MBB4324038.1 hypothetical protein [Agrobacterium radiobacter]MBB4336324.1 hypothetical protein [Agrobacterium radiobacter]MBB4457848.1 hypothetical protein [Agrobacterium radiobacter]
MNIADNTDYEGRDIKWIKDHFERKLLFVDDSFQRKFVWLPKHRIRLMETILAGFPAPEIYLWQTDTDPDTGDSKYSIIDGQQRIRSVVSFLNNEYSLRKNSLNEDYQGASFADKKFFELTNEEKANIWKYRFHIKFISSQVPRDEITDMFLRLNSTNMTLNPQELRHAEFSGQFLEAAEMISSEPLWREYKLFNEAEIRRMRDIQFVSSILIYLRRGVAEELSQSNINRIYDAYNEKYDERTDDEETVIKLAQTAIAITNADDKVLKFIRSKVHLYSLMIVCDQLATGASMQDVQSRFAAFVEAYFLVDPNLVYTTPIEQAAVEYRRLTTEGVQKRYNRTRRISVLRRLLESETYLAENAPDPDQGQGEEEIIDS